MHTHVRMWVCLKVCFMAVFEKKETRGNRKNITPKNISIQVCLTCVLNQTKLYNKEGGMVAASFPAEQKNGNGSVCHLRLQCITIPPKNPFLFKHSHTYKHVHLYKYSYYAPSHYQLPSTESRKHTCRQTKKHM